MKTIKLFKLSMFAVLVLTLPAKAWDGAVAGRILATHVTAGTNFGFRIELEGTPVMCTGGSAWAYLNDNDSNYKTFVSVLLLAKIQNVPVLVYSNFEYGQCHIGYISAGK